MPTPQIENGYTRIANELLDAYIRITHTLSPYENTVWLCVLRKTYGYHKKEDWVSLSQIKEKTGIERSHIARTIKKLKNKRMITHSGEKGKTSLTAIQKNYEEWLLPKQVTVLLPKQVIPKQVMTVTQTGNQLLPKQVDTKDTITKDNTTKDTIVIRDYFYSAYKQAFATDYIANFGKDGKIFKELLVAIPVKELQSLIDMFFKKKDSFTLNAGFTVGVFKSQINKLRMDTIKTEHKHPTWEEGYPEDKL